MESGTNPTHRKQGKKRIEWKMDKRKIKKRKKYRTNEWMNRKKNDRIKENIEKKECKIKQMNEWKKI